MFSQLSGDIVYIILTALPDFSTLLSTIVASKDINTVFETHPSSIIRGVVDNQVGPALPQALRLVRLCELPDSERSLENTPEEAGILDTPITRKQAWELGRNSRVTRQLEALYSFR
jgi:hypothetical protein